LPRVYDLGMTINDQITVGDLERARPKQTAARAEASAPSRVSSWPDLLRLVADLIEEGVPLLEKGGKANVFALLMLFAKVQAAWQGYRDLRKPIAGATP